LRWHWEKAGTIEHVHDVIKNELGGGVLPCGRFGANAAWFRLALITYNVLSAMKSLVLPPSMSSARPKRLRFLVLNVAARVSTHAGRLLLRIGQAAEDVAKLIGARLRLRQMLPALDAG
jgi:Transposase DDE domain group 1